MTGGAPIAAPARAITIAGFFRELFGKFPGHFTVNLALLGLSAAVDSLTLLSLVPVVDWLAGAPSSGGVSRAFSSVMGALGLAPTLPKFLAALVLLQTAASALSVLASRSILLTKYAVERDLLVGSFREFFEAQWRFFSGRSQGTLLNTFSNAVTKTALAFTNLAYLLVVTIRILFCFAVSFGVSWQITGFSVFLTAALLWPFMLLGRASYRLGRDNTATQNTLMSFLFESLGNAKIILAFGVRRRSEREADEAFDGHLRVTMKSQTLDNVLQAGYKPVSLVVLAAALYVAHRLGVALSEITVVLLALLQVAPLMGQMLSLRNSIHNLLPNYEQIKDLRQEAAALRLRTGGRVFRNFEREIALENVGFSYPGRAPVLQGITLRIPKGQFMAVVGESGAGKSTLADLVMLLHEPVGGRITLDGAPVEEFDADSYRGQVGYVPQDSVLFNRSVRENLLWAKEDATEAEIREACVRANAAEFIEKLPDGYETMVGDRGVRLSGGQAQRVSLARAILRKPQLLILDEATSALDTHSERLIQQAIESIARHTTVIAIAHRLSTIMNADHIVLLKDGKIAEEGTYASLLARKGLFHRMVQLQVLRTAEEKGGGAI